MTGKLQQIAGRRQWGITLTELLVTIAIIGILAAIAVPSYRDTIERNRLKTVAEAFKSDMQFARIQAIKGGALPVQVSRSEGTAGNWCYGLAVNAACDCKTEDSCGIKQVSGASFSNKINMETSLINNSFDFRRGTTEAGDTTFSSENYTLQVLINAMGQVTICTASDSSEISGYPGCK